MVMLNLSRSVSMSEISLQYINERIEKDCAAFISECEEHYHALIDSVAKRTEDDREIKIILIAGPSGSGKTTSANLISDRIKKNGRESMVISFDDFYRDCDDPEYPRFENGERDFESPLALNLPSLCETLKNIALGKSFILPKYDFKIAKRVSASCHEPIKDGVVIMEGLHALNPRVFSLLPEEKLLKIFISVSTNIVENGEIIISGRKLRFVRRMVRDSIYRNADAERTLSMWFKVLEGEDAYLYPNRDNADISFDTFHPFEIGIMRPFAETLISDGLSKKEPYVDTVKKALLKASLIPVSSLPENSLIREFVPVGIYEKLY